MLGSDFYRKAQNWVTEKPDFCESGPEGWRRLGGGARRFGMKVLK